MTATLSVIEFVCNLRWVLSYAVQRLDPVLEAHYKHILERARQAESDVSRSYAPVKSLAEVPSDALALAQEGIVYLLVAEGVLGHCPPTMHSFLLRAAAPSGSSVVNACTDGSDVSSLSQLQGARNVYQAHFLCIRWLVAEGLLTEQELLDSLGEDADTSAQGEQGIFELHVSIAKILSSGTSFALQAHVLLTRSLILHYCCSVISVNDIVAHVRFLDPVCSGTLESLEDTLVFWMYHLLKVMHEKKVIDGELYRAAANAIKDSLYHSVQSGVVLGLAVHFYKPALLPLTHLCTSAGDSKTTAQSQEGRLENWGSVLRVSEELGLWPCLYADEVEHYGDVVLQLHVLRFVEELFAVLATQAEDSQDDGESERGPPVSQSVTSLRLDRGGEVGSVPLTEMQSHDILDSVREQGGNEIKLNNWPTEKGDDTSSMEDRGGVNGGPSPSSSSSYPSAHSRRQYDVMMASLRLHGAVNGVSDPPKPNGSPRKPCSSAFSEAAGVVVATAASSASSSIDDVLSATSSRRFVVEHRPLPENRPATELARSSVQYTGRVVMKYNQFTVKEPIAVDPSHSSATANQKNATVLPLSAYPPTDSAFAANALALSNGSLPSQSFMEKLLLGACNRYDPVLVSDEKKLSTLSPLTAIVTDMPNGVRTMTSCTTSESSFPINVLGKLDYSHPSGEMATALTTACLSRPHSPPPWQEEAESQGVSPITPDVTAEQSVVLPQALLNSVELQRATLQASQNSRRPSEARGFSEAQLRDILRDLSAVGPLSFAETSDRHSLLLTLEKQQMLIRRLTNRLEAMAGGNTLWSGDTWAGADGVSTVSEGPGLTRALPCSPGGRTDDSGQHAETDISSVPDDFLDGEGSFLDY
ncbi:uncharacterized protein Tco025E_03081 [Trypanosoma conorhini]|uniref:Calponin-homology (CH) domain-containing protein n=1 Tax=Trypanosoma conorhini TaxID=83891 RepID=A0A422PXI1_9TRYP|nr:uncharacterized protein Tco025E_03081 [Trypanosoma conorhini]RNF22481.1 hypothetical protein Tco025E_03081 [Trypanosoma conorhini]